jgi:hypothetical protein
MKKRIRFGIVVGIAVVILALAGYGGLKLRAANSLPGSNCTSSGNAVITVTIAHGKVSSTLNTFSPGICLRFLVHNSDSSAYDFLIKNPTNNSLLAAATNIAAGQTAQLDYSFADAPSWTPINLVCTQTGQSTAISTEQVYLSK